MYFARIINSFLSKFNIVIKRRSTVDFLHDKVAKIECIEQPNENFENLKQELIRHQIASYWRIVDYIEGNIIQSKITIECPLCNYKDKKEVFKKLKSYCIFGGGVLNRHQCPNCELIFGAEKVLNLSDKELTKDYEWHYKVYAEGDSTPQEIRAFHSLNPSKEGLYLNYGAGAWSKSIQILREEGWNVYGFEPYSSDNSEFIVTDYKQLQTMKFDGIFSNNVLEHFNKPAKELKDIGKLLKDGALMSHATPCFEYLYEYTRFHLFFFLGKSREILAQKADLEIVDFIVDDEFMNIILKVK